VMNASPDGQNINLGAGALHPEALQKEVLRSRAHLGVAFDGDGDRLISVDEEGQIRDGDFALAICGRHLASRGQLKGGTVVTTVMANLALDRALTQLGVRIVKVQVGDRYVLEEMLRIGANVGGEQSGHLLFLDHATTGDGIVSALQLIGVMQETKSSLGELSRCMTKFPQVLLNVAVTSKPPVDQIPGLVDRAKALEQEMAGAGRVLLRYSGTESLAAAGDDRGRGPGPHRGDGRGAGRHRPAGHRRMSRVLGIGVDLTQMPRMRRVVARWDERFLQRVFTEQEIAYCRRRRDPIPHLAARFAAKEATLKALGTGLSMGVNWRELEVRRERGQAPTMVLSGRCREIAESKGGRRVLLSLTHDGEYAMAQAMLIADTADDEARPR